MTLPVRPGGVAAIAVAATLGLSATAGATAGKLSFQQTYPIASQLCAKIAAGKGPKRLRKSSPQVLTDCGALQSSFDTARAAVLAAEASIASARAAEHAVTKAACAGTLANSASCTKTRRTVHKALEALDRQRSRAAHAYYAAAEAARRTFWAAIQALPGGKGLHADAPIHQQSS
jgi:hypothetical protein